MSGRGQASVEMVACVLGLTFAALAVVQLLLLASARQRAHRVADQAAVLVAQGRPLPDDLRRDVHVRVEHGVVSVTLTSPALPGMPGVEVRETVVLP